MHHFKQWRNLHKLVIFSCYIAWALLLLARTAKGIRPICSLNFIMEKKMLTITEFDLISSYGLTFYMIEHIPRIALIITVFILTFIINLPFGYYRRKARRFSFKWFLYIHLPIPVIVAARLISNLDFRYVPLFIIAAITGQFLGSRLDI